MRMLDYGFYQLFKTMGCIGTSYDSEETDDNITLNITVPGLEQEDLVMKISSQNRLIVKSLKETKYTPKFHYVFLIPCEINKEETYASMDNGILTIVLKKKKSDEFIIKMP